MENFVGQREKTGSRANFGRVSSSRELSARISLVRNRFSQLIYIDTRQIELANFFLQRHSAHQVIQAFVNRALRVKIKRSIARRLRG